MRDDWVDASLLQVQGKSARVQVHVRSHSSVPVVTRDRAVREAV